jgi:5'-nucleotidase
MRQIARALAAGSILTVLVATPATAQTYPPDEPTVEVSDSTVQPCDTITVTGSNQEAGSTVNITFDGEVIGSATVAADGTFSATVQIPCDTAPGTYVLSAGGANTEITVLAAGAAGGGADTGADVSAGMAIMVGLFVLGVGALMATRRRSRVPEVDTPA